MGPKASSGLTALSLKLAEIELMHEITGEYPILFIRRCAQ